MSDYFDIRNNKVTKWGGFKMGKHAVIISVTDERISQYPNLKDYIDLHSSDIVTHMTESELLVILKNVKQTEQSTEKVRMTAGDIARQLGKLKVQKVTIAVDTLQTVFTEVNDHEATMAFVEGWHLGQYEYTTYKSKEPLHHTELHIEGDEVAEAVNNGKIRAASMNFSRDLMNDIPSELNPTTFPKRLKDELEDSDVTIEVFNKAKLEEMEMNGLLTVGQGSEHDPVFVEISYQGDASKPLVALVGKGVTYDTGGINLKQGRHLSDMRMDMGGAAAVAGAMKLLAESKAKVNVVALLQIVENMPDSKAILPGDVIRYKNGKTVQIGNTDAEGRLILADGLLRAGELEAEYVVDIATLTGAIANALGSKLAGVFGDEELAYRMKQLGDENGDHNWPMPLVEAYENYLDSDYADFNNISKKGEAGSITAELFLRRFVPKSCKWLHVDMAGVMSSKEDGYYVSSATGFGARLLADYTEMVSK